MHTPKTKSLRYSLCDDNKKESKAEMVSDIGSLFGRIPLEKISIPDKNSELAFSDDSDSESHAMMFLR